MFHPDYVRQAGIRVPANLNVHGGYAFLGEAPHASSYIPHLEGETEARRTSTRYLPRLLNHGAINAPIRMSSNWRR